MIWINGFGIIFLDLYLDKRYVFLMIDFISGATTLLGATGNLTQMGTLTDNFLNASNCVFGGTDYSVDGQCKYGLLYSFSVSYAVNLSTYLSSSSFCNPVVRKTLTFASSLYLFILASKEDGAKLYIF